MREIKFRAWDKKENEMFYSSMYQDKTSMIFGLSNFLNECSDIEDTLMQYSGSKDKNGVEIYEGDILEAFDILGEREIYPVIFIDGAFMGKRLDDEEFPYFYLFANKSLSETYKVIGNIYENPELLESNKC